MVAIKPLNAVDYMNKLQKKPATPTNTPKPVLNFWPWISQKNTTNINDIKKPTPLPATPVKKTGVFDSVINSVIPTTNASTPEFNDIDKENLQKLKDLWIDDERAIKLVNEKKIEREWQPQVESTWIKDLHADENVFEQTLKAVPRWVKNLWVWTLQAVWTLWQWATNLLSKVWTDVVNRTVWDYITWKEYKAPQFENPFTAITNELEWKVQAPLPETSVLNDISKIWAWGSTAAFNITKAPVALWINVAWELPWTQYITQWISKGIEWGSEMIANETGLDKETVQNIVITWMNSLWLKMKGGTMETAGNMKSAFQKAPSIPSWVLWATKVLAKDAVVKPVVDIAKMPYDVAKWAVKLWIKWIKKATPEAVKEYISPTRATEDIAANVLQPYKWMTENLDDANKWLQRVVDETWVDVNNFTDLQKNVWKTKENYWKKLDETLWNIQWEKFSKSSATALNQLLELYKWTESQASKNVVKRIYELWTKNLEKWLSAKEMQEVKLLHTEANNLFNQKWQATGWFMADDLRNVRSELKTEIEDFWVEQWITNIKDINQIYWELLNTEALVNNQIANVKSFKWRALPETFSQKIWSLIWKIPLVKWWIQWLFREAWVSLKAWKIDPIEVQKRLPELLRELKKSWVKEWEISKIEVQISNYIEEAKKEMLALPQWPIVPPAPEFKSNIKVTPSEIQPNVSRWLKELPEWRKQAIITPQTKESWIVQESKKWVNKWVTPPTTEWPYTPQVEMKRLPPPKNPEWAKIVDKFEKKDKAIIEKSKEDLKVGKNETINDTDIKNSILDWQNNNKYKEISKNFRSGNLWKTENSIIKWFIEKWENREEYIYKQPRSADVLADIIKENIPDNTSYSFVKDITWKDISNAYGWDLQKIKAWVDWGSPWLVDSKVYSAFKAVDRNIVKKEFDDFLKSIKPDRIWTKSLTRYTNKDYNIWDTITFNSPISSFWERYRTYDYEKDMLTRTFWNNIIHFEPNKDWVIIDINKVLWENSIYKWEREFLLPPWVKMKVVDKQWNNIYVDIEIPTKEQLKQIYEQANKSKSVWIKPKKED